MEERLGEDNEKGKQMGGSYAFFLYKSKMFS